MKVYIIGSLRNPNVPAVAQELREQGFEVFDDWFASGEHADEEWMRYEKQRGHTYLQALNGFTADHVFGYDVAHLVEADAVVLIGPAGKSAYLELGWALGQRKKGYIYLPFEPDRWDFMPKFADGVFDKIEDLVAQLTKDEAPDLDRSVGWARDPVREFRG